MQRSAGRVGKGQVWPCGCPWARHRQGISQAHAPFPPPRELHNPEQHQPSGPIQSSLESWEPPQSLQPGLGASLGDFTAHAPGTHGGRSSCLAAGFFLGVPGRARATPPTHLWLLPPTAPQACPGWVEGLEAPLPAPQSQDRAMTHGSGSLALRRAPQVSHRSPP